MTKRVYYEMDPMNPPPLTEAQRLELKALAAMTDDQIDYSDISKLPESFWTNARRNPYYRSVKQDEHVEAQESKTL